MNVRPNTRLFGKALQARQVRPTTDGYQVQVGHVGKQCGQSRNEMIGPLVGLARVPPADGENDAAARKALWHAAIRAWGRVWIELRAQTPAKLFDLAPCKSLLRHQL